MSDWKLLRSTPVLPLALLLGVAAAAPVLPSTSVAETALQGALTVPAPGPVVAAAQPVSAVKAAAPVKAAPAAPVKAAAPAKPKPAPVKAAAPAKPAPIKAAAPTKAAPKPTAEQLRQQNIAAAQAATTKRSGRSAVVRATSYTSLASQTDSSPFITATGTRTRFGVIAVSRDLLQRFPYGTRVVLEDLTGHYSKMLAGKVFVVEDTMNPRLANTIDVWLPNQSQSLQWGARSVRITAVK